MKTTKYAVTVVYTNWKERTYYMLAENKLQKFATYPLFMIIRILNFFYKKHVKGFTYREVTL